MKNQSCCFTGHRKITEEERQKIQKRLKIELKELFNQGVRNFYCGGALGFDTISAIAVMQLRIEFPEVKLIMILPCKEQGKSWNVVDLKIYYYILNHADKVIYTAERYTIGCMHKRNRYLVDNSRVCICYLKEAKSGTAYTFNYAKKKGLQIINLAEE